MLRKDSSTMRLGIALLGVVFLYSSKGVSDVLTLVDELPIKYGAASQILFSPSGDKAIIEWPKHGEFSACLVDITSEGLKAVELHGPRAFWSADGPKVLSKKDELPDEAFRSFFNTKKARLGTEDGGVTLVNESGNILRPNWHSKSVQGRVPRTESPREVVAVVGKRRYPVMALGKKYPIKATFDPILKRILLHGRDGRELIDISGASVERTHLPDTLLFTLVPGQDLLIAVALSGGDEHGREPTSMTVHVADIQGNLIAKLPIAMEYPEVSITDVIIRCSSKLVLITTRNSIYVFKIQ